MSKELQQPTTLEIAIQALWDGDLEKLKSSGITREQILEMHRDKNYEDVYGNFLDYFRFCGTPKQLEHVLDIIGNDFSIAVAGREGEFKQNLAQTCISSGNVGLLEVAEQRGLNFDDPDLFVRILGSDNRLVQKFGCARYTGEISPDMLFTVAGNEEFSSSDAVGLFKKAKDVANMRTEYGETPLHFVRSTDKAAMLIAAGVDMNKRADMKEVGDGRGQTAFETQGNRWHLWPIVAAGADVLHGNAFHVLCKNGKVSEVIQIYETIGSTGSGKGTERSRLEIDLNRLDSEGRTYFATLVGSGNIDDIKAAHKKCSPNVNHPSVLEAIKSRAEHNETKNGVEIIKQIFDDLGIDAPHARGQVIAKAIRGFEKSAALAGSYKPVPQL